MAVVVVGGQTRNIGKTSVMAGLISGVPERNWTAIKITQEKPGICPMNGPGCGCAADQHTWTMVEERDAAGKGDTCRFLRAGARRALWLRVKQGRLAEAWPELRSTIEHSEDIMVESNSVMAFLRPDLYLSVLDPAEKDFKSSAREFLDRADALILSSGSESAAEWDSVSFGAIAGKPTFRIEPPPYVTPQLVQFAREKIGQGASGVR